MMESPGKTVQIDESKFGNRKYNKALEVTQPEPKNESYFKTQREIFQSSMKYCIVSGKCLGVFPFMDMDGKDVQKLKYKLFSWKYSLCYIMLVGEVSAAAFSLFKLVFVSLSLSSVRFFVFYTGNFITSILFTWLSTKWSHLTELVATSKLDEYVDSSVKFKCKFATIAILGCSLFQLATAKTYVILSLHNDRWLNRDINSYEKYLRDAYSWAYDPNLAYSFAIGIVIQIFHLMNTLIWTYPHLFIICISIYLTSILELLNKKIISCEGKDLPASHWRAMREDYNQATLLIRSFDDAINGITFIVTANDLFFVCCQLYYLIGELIRGSTQHTYPEDAWGIFTKFEFTIFMIITVTFYVLRFFAFIFVAAKIHTASLEAIPSLYDVSTSSYCSEVQRFIEKVNGDTVALTGLNFFYITRGMILSVIGTIVTYELVLLQFKRN